MKNLIVVVVLMAAVCCSGIAKAEAADNIKASDLETYTAGMEQTVSALEAHIASMEQAVSAIDWQVTKYLLSKDTATSTVNSDEFNKLISDVALDIEKVPGRFIDNAETLERLYSDRIELNKIRSEGEASLDRLFMVTVKMVADQMALATVQLATIEHELMPLLDRAKKAKP